MTKRLEIRIKPLTNPKMTRREAYEFVEKLFREAQLAATPDSNSAQAIELRDRRDNLQRLLMYFASTVPAKAKDSFSYLARFVAVKDVRHFLQYVFVADGVAYASDGSMAARAKTELPDGYYEPKTGARLADEDAKGLRFPLDTMKRIYDDALKIKNPKSFKVYEGIGKSEVSKAGRIYRFQGFDEKFGFNCALLDRAANKEPLTIYTSEQHAMSAAIVEGGGVLADDVLVMPLRF